jgi:hypothetical protein
MSTSDCLRDAIAPRKNAEAKVSDSPACCDAPAARAGAFFFGQIQN